jgi:mannose-6-phosphate isomerase-like protein (cupin superfamily)
MSVEGIGLARWGSALSLSLALGVLPPPLPARCQSEPMGTVNTPLAAAHLDSATGMPLFFRLYRARLPAAAHTSYEGANALLYALGGAVSLEVEGGGTQTVGESGGAFIAAGQTVTIRASASAPADLLLFLLTARPNERRPVLARPAVIRELFRTPEPLPGLQEGQPYDFTLARLTLPPDTAAGPAHSLSGAALDYVLAGTAALTADSKTETTPAEMPLFERFGWVHQLANPGSEPLVLLQVSLSQAATPAVQPAAGK